MNGEAVKELATRFQKPFEINGFIVRPDNWTAEDPLGLVKAGPSAATLKVSTLGTVRDYIKANRDNLDIARLALHVVSPSTVQVLGPLAERSRAREVFMTAVCADLTDSFLGRFWSLDEFLISLQVRFADADDRKKLLTLLSNVKHENVKTALDDGMTQVVQARAGVALVSDLVVPNPVTLCPYRTFRDILQPSSLFVLRLNSGKSGGLPEAGLFEADGGAWRLSATQRIQDWLMLALADVAVLA